MLIRLETIINTMTIKQLFIIILIFSYNGILHAKQFILENVIFEGLHRVNLETALFSMPVHVGDVVDTNDFNKIIKSLFATGKFEDIQVLNNNNSVLIKIVERPVITDIVFYGNKLIKEDILKKILELQDIRIGNVLNYFSVMKAEKDLNEFYYSIGKFQAIIRIIVSSCPENCVNLKVSCIEGISAKIKQINCIGNVDYNINQLLHNFQFCNKTQWWNITGYCDYHNQKLYSDLYALRSFYLNRGYVRFNIDSTHISLTPDKKDVYVTLYLTEGNRYFFSDVVVKCQSLEFLPQIQQLVKINKGELYDNFKINKIKDDIVYFLGNHGYVYPHVLVNEQINDLDKEVSLQILVDIGNKFYVRQINFEGNYLTKDEVLRREMRQIEGMWYVVHLIEQGKERLERLGYFDFVEVEIKRVLDILDQVDIVYKVKERNTGSMNISLGVGTESGINFQFGIQEENWLGTGNIFGFHGIKNSCQIYTELSFFNPYFTVDAVSLGGKLFYNNFNANNTELSDYDLKSYGLGFNMGLPIKEYHSFNLGMDYVYNNLSNIKPQVVIWRYLKTNGVIPKIEFNNKLNHDLNFNAKDFFLIFSWNFNTLNRGYFPTSGLYSRFLSKLTTPGSDNQYFQFLYDSDYYMPLNIDSTLIFMHRVRLGYSIGFNNKEMPFYDNFHAGGVNSIRGFRSNTIGPKAAYYKCSYSDNNYDECVIENSSDAIGGNAIIIIKNELIIPSLFTYLKSFKNTIRTSLFLDAGSVWDTSWKNTANTRAAGILNYSTPKNIRMSGGIAIHWLSPFGPVVLSYAQFIKKYAGDQLEQFQFNVGKTW